MGEFSRLLNCERKLHHKVRSTVSHTREDVTEARIHCPMVVENRAREFHSCAWMHLLPHSQNLIMIRSRGWRQRTQTDFLIMSVEVSYFYYHCVSGYISQLTYYSHFKNRYVPTKYYFGFDYRRFPRRFDKQCRCHRLDEHL